MKINQFKSSLHVERPDRVKQVAAFCFMVIAIGAISLFVAAVVSALFLR